MEQLKRFDIASESPGSAGVGIALVPIPWFAYLHQEGAQFKDDLGHVVDKYATYLDPDTLDVAEQLIDSAFIHIIVDWGPRIVAHARSFGNKGQLPIFAEQEMVDAVREYTEAFCGLVEIYNRGAADDKMICVAEFTEVLWRNDSAPQIGSARVSM
jgi:hypothetical protein